VNSVLREFLPSEDFKPQSLSCASAIALMKGMRSMERTV
jgi:hypothetical protein